MRLSYGAEPPVAEPPIGALKLAVAEAITNTVVHALRDRQPGTVTVPIFIKPEANEVKVLVTDDGIGCAQSAQPWTRPGDAADGRAREPMEVCEGPLAMDRDLLDLPPAGRGRVTGLLARAFLQRDGFRCQRCGAHWSTLTTSRS